MAKNRRDFLIRRDHSPLKVLYMEPARVGRFMYRLQSRFPNHTWSVSERFC